MLIFSKQIAELNEEKPRTSLLRREVFVFLKEILFPFFIPTRERLCLIKKKGRFPGLGKYQSKIKLMNEKHE